MPGKRGTSKLESVLRALGRSLRSRTGRQTLSLYGAQLLVLALGVVATTLQARLLGPADYGVLAFALTFTRFLVPLFGFGFSHSGALLLARASDPGALRRRLGAVLVATFLAAVLFAATVFGVSFHVDRWFGTRVGPILRAASPLLIALPLEALLPQLARGTNRIALLSAFTVLNRALYLAAFGVLLAVEARVEVLPLLLLQLGALGTAGGVALARLRPVFDDLAQELRRLVESTRVYGVHVWAGQVVNQSTYQIDGILLTFFRDTTSLGFFNIAASLASPLALFSQSLSASLFRDFASRNEIPREVFLVNTIWLALGALALAGIGGAVAVLLFGTDYAAVGPLMLPLAVAGFCSGMHQPYGFLAARGRGEWVRRSAFAQGAASLLGGLALIPLWGALGAAIANAIARFVHWQMLAYYYRRFRSEPTPPA